MIGVLQLISEISSEGFGSVRKTVQGFLSSRCLVRSSRFNGVGSREGGPELLGEVPGVLPINR